jgi:hypothetical protein
MRYNLVAWRIALLSFEDVLIPLCQKLIGPKHKLFWFAGCLEALK